MQHVERYEPASRRAVLFCSPNLVLGMLVASALEPWRIRVDVAPTPADALTLLDRGAHYCLTVLDRRHRHLPDGLRRHPLVDRQTIIEIDGVLADDESVPATITLAERQAVLLAPAIVEQLEPLSSSPVVH